MRAHQITHCINKNSNNSTPKNVIIISVVILSLVWFGGSHFGFCSIFFYSCSSLFLSFSCSVFSLSLSRMRSHFFIFFFFGLLWRTISMDFLSIHIYFASRSKFQCDCCCLYLCLKVYGKHLRRC